MMTGHAGYRLGFLVAAAAFMLSGSLAAQDYGDAPAPYPTAEHTSTGWERFGPICIDDATNPVVPPWTGSADDDGIGVSNLAKGADATIVVNIQNFYTQDDIGVWIDWNDDGDWDDAGEQVIWAGFSPSAPDGSIGSGDNVFTVPVPATAAGASAKIRARIWDTSSPGTCQCGPDQGGEPRLATDYGEVEDYNLVYEIIGDPEIDIRIADEADKYKLSTRD